MNRSGAQRGAVFLPFMLSAFTFCAVMGTLVESTLLLHARSRVFNDAESAVLAAANLYAAGMTDEAELTSAIKTQYCSGSFLDADNTSLNFSQIANDVMIIQTSKNIPFLFLPDILVDVVDNSVGVTANLAATVPQPVGSLSGLAPLVVQEQTFQMGVEYDLKEGAGDGTTGNYGALDLGAGAKTYEAVLKYGYDGTVSIGDMLATKTGNMAGPTADGIGFRLGDDDPRNDVLLVVVTADEWPAGSSQDITVKGFAAFRVTGVVGTGNDKGNITGEFISFQALAEATAGAPDFGLYTRAKLTYYTS